MIYNDPVPPKPLRAPLKPVKAVVAMSQPNHVPSPLPKRAPHRAPTPEEVKRRLALRKKVQAKPWMKFHPL
jgi:hypothetical protein